MDFLNGILNPGKRRGGGNDFFDTLRGASRWVVSCGCALLLLIILVILLIVGGAIRLGENAVTAGVVIVMIVVAVVSLVRTARS